jgi:hypothetical protein
MHLADIYEGEWVEQEGILFRVTDDETTPLTKNDPPSFDGLFAGKEPPPK